MTVCIYGGSGRTGQLVAAALQRRNVPVRLIGRNKDKLQSAVASVQGRIGWAVAPATDANALDRALSGAWVLLNCAGPFVVSAQHVMQAALRNRIAYIDVSGEGRHVGTVYEQWDIAAKDARVALCPAVGAVGALGDWGAHSLRRMLGTAPQSIDVTYIQSVRQFMRLSEASMLSAAAQEFAARPGHAPGIMKQIHAPAPFGRGGAVRISGPEEWSIPKHLPFCAVRTFFSLDPGGPMNPVFMSGLGIGYPLLAAAALRSRNALHRWRLVNAPPQSHTAQSAVLLDGSSGHRRAQLAFLFRDAYEISAGIVELAIGRILQTNIVSGGVLAPSQIASPIRALRHLSTTRQLVAQRRVMDDRSQ